ncbi:MAG: HEAT repeat domain-containing protein [Promethearchaeota archaeon]|jgi:HEAT repeat protein
MQKTNIDPQEIYRRSEEFGLNNSANMLKDIIETGKDDNLRKEAIKFLASISNNSKTVRDECFETFENLLVSDDKVEIKCEAARALGRIKIERGLKPLNWVLNQEETNAEVRLNTLKAIHKIKFQEDEIYLFISELNSEFSSIKTYVRNQLLSLNPEKLVNFLLISLKNRKISNNHKIELIKLIGFELNSINSAFEEVSYISSKYPEIISELIKNKEILLEVITQILRDEDSELMNSVITIFKLMGEEIGEDLIRLLLIDDFIVKKNAIKICGKLRFVDAVDLLTTNIDNLYHEVSIASIEALGEIGDILAVPELLVALDIEDTSFEYVDLDMKLYIIDAVKKIYLNNENASYDYLFSYLNKESVALKESIAFILGEIGAEDFVNPLMELLREKNVDVKKNSIIALGKIGSIEPLEQLISILKDEDSYWLIKKVAVDSIYNIFQRNWYRIKENGKEIEQSLKKKMIVLIDHLKSEETENFKVKLSLIKFMENFGNQLALSALLKRINDFHRVVRIHASNAIKKIEEKIEQETQ